MVEFLGKGCRAIHVPGGLGGFSIGRPVPGLPDVNVDGLRLWPFFDDLILRSETCLMNAGMAGRQPQIMPQVISAVL